MTMKKKRGRPPANNPATEQLGMIRVTSEQRQNYLEASDIKGKPLAAWVKDSLDKAAKRDLKK